MSNPAEQDTPAAAEPRIRLFVAIPLPAEVREALAELQERLRKGFGFTACRPDWAAPETMHLTLRFLGLVRESQVAAMSDAMAAAAGTHPEMLLSAGGFGVFPHWSAPKVLWIGVSEKTGALRRLHADMEAIAVRHDCKPEPNPFRPHLTLARFKSLRGVEAARSIVQTHQVFRIPIFSAAGAVLFTSRTRSEGAVHTAVREFPFQIP